VTRAGFDMQLQDITTRMIRLGTLVETALEHVLLQTVETGDQALCGLVMASDTTIDDLHSEVERLALDSLTLQHPLAGRVLRFLSTATSITTDVERRGGNAVGRANLLVRMAPLQSVISVILMIIRPDILRPAVRKRKSV